MRQDFVPYKLYLEKLNVIANEFHRLNTKDWVHYKTKEDYDNIFDFPEAIRIKSEKIYIHGRDMAGGCAAWLSNYDDVSQYPTIDQFIYMLEKGWIGDIEGMEQRHKEYSDLLKINGITLFSLDGMLELFSRQIEMLKAARRAVSQIKLTEEYANEIQGKPMTNPSKNNNITITSEGGNIIAQIGNNNSAIQKGGKEVVRKGDVTSLTNALSALGISHDDAEKLIEILNKPDVSKDKLPVEFTSWLGGMVIKASEGAWSFAIEKAAPTLIALGKSFLGIPF